MGYAFRISLVDIFMCCFSGRQLRHCPNIFNPVFHRCYFDEVFALAFSPDYADKVKEYL